GEFDQGTPVIVTVLVEEVPVELFLQPVANRLKDERGEHDQSYDRSRAEVLRPGEGEDQAVENAQDDQRGQSVNVTLLENDVYIHQAVTEDRVGPGQRDQNQGEHRHFLVVARERAEQIRHGINQSEGYDADQRSIAQIFELPADQRIFHLRNFQPKC